MWEQLINNDFPCASVDCLADIIHPHPHDPKKHHYHKYSSTMWLLTLSSPHQYDLWALDVLRRRRGEWLSLQGDRVTDNGWKMVACLEVRVNYMLITNDKVEKWVQDIIYPGHINQDLTRGIYLSSTQQQLNKYQKHSQYVVKLTVNMQSEKKSGTEYHQVTSIFACLQLFLWKTVNITGTTFIMRVNNQILKPWHLNYK